MGLAIGGHRAVALVTFPVAAAAGVYLQRFGTRWLACGVLAFIGDIMGFFLHKALGLGDLGWLAAEAGIGRGLAMIVRFALFYSRNLVADTARAGLADAGLRLGIEEWASTVGPTQLAIRDLLLIDGTCRPEAPASGSGCHHGPRQRWPHAA